MTQIHAHWNEKLLSIGQLVDGEKYREALKEIAKLRKKKPQKGDLLRLVVLESRCLMGLGECDKAFGMAHDVVEEESQFQEHKTTVIEAMLEVADSSLCLFKVDTAFEMCKQAEQLRQELPTDDEDLRESLRAHILYVKSIAFYYRDDVHQGIECAQESLSIREKLGDLEGVVSSLIRIGYLHLEVDPLQTLEYYERGLELNKELDRKRHIIQTLQMRGMFQKKTGEQVDAEQLMLQSLNLAREHEMGGLIRTGLWCLAYLYLGKGDFERSEKFFKECLSLAENVGAGLLTALCSVNLGEIHRTRGDLEKALRAYEKSMSINKKMGRTKGYLVSLGNCGLVQYAMGYPDRALNLLEESLALAERQEQAGLLGGFVRSNTILNIISILVDKGMVNEAQKRLERVRQISEETSSTYDEQAYRIAAALVLKSSMIPENRARAKEYLTGVVDGSFFDYEISALALLHLTEILVNELHVTGDEDVLQNLEVHLRSLLKMATDQGSTLLMVETLLLRSKVALLRLETGEANRLLDQAQALAEQKGLQRILKRIVDERSILLSELKLWENLGDDGPPLVERTEKIRIHEQIGGMIQQGLWRKMLF